MKYSMVIELEYPYDDELSCAEIERNVAHAIKPYLERNELTAAHVEASAGTLHDAFGVGFKSIVGSMRSTRPGEPR